MTLGGKMFRRGPADVLLAMEAWVLLAFFRICLAVVPVRRIIPMVLRRRSAKAGEGDVVSADSASVSAALRVQWAVGAAARYSVVDFVCFPQTLAGYTMLKWRGVSSTMVYGVARSPESKLIAHTWLMLADKTVLGGEGSAGFSEVERWS
jgi:hypothetical protein